MESIDLSREKFLQEVVDSLESRTHIITDTPNELREAIEDWDKFGGFEKVRDSS